ncbi:amino acid transporter [Gonapodya prolifera JEL478]|uniref:Amino acid transporter n=1 Tax=Gonapodya prolifera (strain JEL478) TaxID=1344416 RepID=A0A139AR09_GONPJ|nr:amino acid transporter [Gonapodya prolifera JEL478]|eukprot:KXS19094.1 amino acid transporter [Gonapodya prolifera JEL478]
MAEFTRGFSFIHNFGISLSHISIIAAVAALYTFALGYGGPAGAVWGWIIVSLLSLCVGSAMAEICSAYPTAGGLYYWSSKLGGDLYGPTFAWFTGWFNLIGDVASCGSGAVVISQAIFTIVLVKNPDFEVTSWKLSLLAIGISFTWIGLNFHPTLIKRSLEASVIVHTVGLLLMLICIGGLTPNRQTAAFVFTELANVYSGQDSQGFSFLLSFLMPAWTFIGYDASAHVSEETQGAYKEAPRGIFLSVLTSAILGLVLVLVMTFSIVDFDTLLASPYPAPIMQMFLDSTQQNEALACIMMAIVGAAAYFACLSIVCANSRMIYAFSRDQAFGTVVSKALYYTSPTTKLPVHAICLSTFLADLIIAIGFGSSVALQVAASIGTVGMMTAYALPIFCRLTFARKVFKKGEFHLGPLSEIIGWIAVIWSAFLFVLLCLPYTYPITSLNFNYASVLIGGYSVIVGTVWFFSAKSWFKGPVPYVSEDEIKEMEGVMADEAEKSTAL